jgi:pimeloyl-ACP methyl ester carboxylesterase
VLWRPKPLTPGTLLMRLQRAVAKRDAFRPAYRMIEAGETQAAIDYCLAGEHDRTASPAVVRRMAEKIPGARYVELAGAGHLMNFEAPEAFTQALLDFLQTTQEETHP